MKNPRTEILKQRRQIRKEILVGEDADHDDSSKQRFYSIRTKTKRAIKVELGFSESKEADTSLEVFVEDILKEYNVKYFKQKRVSYLNYDFYLPEYNLLIEVNGEYWHVDERIYPNGPKNKIQKRNIEKNKLKEKIARDANIPMIEIWENEIEKFPETTKKGLLKLLGKA